MKTFNTIAKTIVLTSLLSVAACTSEPGQDAASNGNAAQILAVPNSLNQAAFNGSVYDYGYNSIPNIAFSGAPTDVDYSRSAMLHDGSTYRLYFFKQGSNDTLYQFGFNLTTLKYEYGYNSIPTLSITGIPADADTSNFAMLHDGSVYRLYMRSKTNVTTMYQFGYNASTQDYEYGYLSIAQLYITMAPADVDHSRWAMLHDGTYYRLYIGKAGEDDKMYQFAYNSASSDYEWGYKSIPLLAVTDMPSSSIKTDFSMLHDGSDYRFYYKADL